MATFITTIKFSDKGIAAIRDTAKRVAALKTTATKMRAKVSEVYWTLGSFDGLIVFDAPDDETATALMLQISSQGNVHTTTSRAFDAAAMEKILGKMAK